MLYSVPNNWYDGAYKDEAPAVMAARSFRITAGHSRAVLLIHGYGGYPGELVRPARDLEEAGFDVFVPRLPGMGTSGKDFLQSTSADWEKVVYNALADLNTVYRTVSIVAHSMGTLLALLAAEQYKVDRIVLAAPAFSIPSLRKWQVKTASLFRKDIPVKWQSNPSYRMYYENAPADDETLGREYWSHLYPTRLVDLENLRRRVMKIRSLDAGVLVIACMDDRVTDPTGCESFIADHPGIRTSLVRIDGATHYVYYDIDKSAEEQAVQATVDFLL